MRTSLVVGIVVVVIIVAIIAALLARPPAPAPSATTVTTSLVTTSVVTVSGQPTTVTVTVTQPATATTATTTAPATITFYTWWAGLERFAIDAVIGNFTKLYGINVEKTAVPGGAGVNAKIAILTLIQAGKPPAAFQVHCGPEMISYIYAAPNGANSFVNMTSYAQQIGLIQQGPGVAWSCSLNGAMYSLPVNVHRANLIIYNKHLLDKIGASVPTTVQDLIAVCQKAAAAGIPCLVLGGADQFTLLQTWENIFLAVAGPYKFMQFLYGTLPPNDPSIVQATQLYLNLTKYLSPDWAGLDWTGAVADVVQGKAIAHVDGDWAVGLIHNVYPNVTMCPVDNITPNCDIVFAPFPGTQGVYSLVIDSVAVPVGPEAQYGIKFATFFAGPRGQAIFNPIKGSIATYKNISASIYPTTVQQWEAQQYRDARFYVFSLTHGGLFSDVWQNLLQQVVVLTQTGRADLWYSTVAKALSTEGQEWSGWYMGFPNNKFWGNATS
jgi:glucose/arabinose transport system substrate-binding protein